jgi:hypothetical protein
LENLEMTEMTSIQTVTDSLVTETLGGSFLGNFVALPADGTRGGIILACSKKKNILCHSGHTEVWTLTAVYGPQGNTEKLNFLQEIKQTKPIVQSY